MRVPVPNGTHAHKGERRMLDEGACAREAAPSDPQADSAHEGALADPIAQPASPKVLADHEGAVRTRETQLQRRGQHLSAIHPHLAREFLRSRRIELELGLMGALVEAQPRERARAALHDAQDALGIDRALDQHILPVSAVRVQDGPRPDPICHLHPPCPRPLLLTVQYTRI